MDLALPGGDLANHRSPDFLRPDGNQTPQVMLGIGGAYPTYIGAVEPKFGNPATLIAIQ